MAVLVAVLCVVVDEGLISFIYESPWWSLGAPLAFLLAFICVGVELGAV